MYFVTNGLSLSTSTAGSMHLRAMPVKVFESSSAGKMKGFCAEVKSVISGENGWSPNIGMTKDGGGEGDKDGSAVTGESRGEW